MIINTSSSVTVNVVVCMTSPNEGIRDYKHPSVQYNTTYNKLYLSSGCIQKH